MRWEGTRVGSVEKKVATSESICYVGVIRGVFLHSWTSRAPFQPCQPSPVLPAPNPATPPSCHPPSCPPPPAPCQSLETLSISSIKQDLIHSRCLTFKTNDFKYSLKWAALLSIKLTEEALQYQSRRWRLPATENHNMCPGFTLNTPPRWPHMWT